MMACAGKMTVRNDKVYLLQGKDSYQTDILREEQGSGLGCALCQQVTQRGLDTMRTDLLPGAGPILNRGSRLEGNLLLQDGTTTVFAVGSGVARYDGTNTVPDNNIRAAEPRGPASRDRRRGLSSGMVGLAGGRLLLRQGL